MKIAIGNDQHGFEYKKLIVELFPQHEFIDVGSHNKEPVFYPEIAQKVANHVSSGECERGILICGTGIGMAMTANKVKGCYAAVCHDAYSTERSILSNNGNIFCAGALVIGKKTLETLIKLWMELEFDPESPSASKVAQMRQIEGMSQ
jgi:ribose 5-phosphate isomerase B